MKRLLSSRGVCYEAGDNIKRLNLEQVREINRHISKFKGEFNESIQLTYPD